MSENFLDKDSSKSGNESGGAANVRRRSVEQFRVVINKEASEALAKMLGRVNEGFEHGEVTKSDLANWIIQRAVRTVSEQDVRELRELYFDERAALGALFCRTKNDPDAFKEGFRQLLATREGLGKPERRRGRKPRVQAAA